MHIDNVIFLILSKNAYTKFSEGPQNMCDPSDALWLDDFYSRIMNQTDPLALYHKATTPTNAHKRNQPTSTSDTNADVQKSTTGRYVLLLAALLIILLIAVFFFYLR